MEQKQDKLWIVSICLAVLSLAFFPVFLGFAGFVVGLVSTCKGEIKGVIGLILSPLCGFIGIILGVMYLASLI